MDLHPRKSGPRHLVPGKINCRIIDNRKRVYPIRVIRNKEFSLIHNPNFRKVTSNVTLSGVLAELGHADAKRTEHENQAVPNSFYDARGTSPAAEALVHKLNHRDEYELYNLEKDPYELRNEINNPAYRAVAEKMKACLSARLTELGDPDPIATETALAGKTRTRKSAHSSSGKGI